ncbi:MAG: LCP family protein [Agathobacter sp.]|nr:LCP family protein [Agathobacter sp.]
MATNRKRRRKRRRGGRNKLILFIFELLLLAILLVGLYLYNKTFGQITYQDKMNDSEAGINKDADLTLLEGYTNIALMGLDNRSNGTWEAGNSDTIIVASINNETKDVQLISIYRDTYLSVGNGKFRKANAAYANGGAKQTVQMLNSNLDLDIKEYICVDWKAVVDAIDALGGVEIEVTKAEVDEINYLLPEIDGTTGYRTDRISGTGKMTLNGTQACAYARIRSTAGDDFLRASRQRIVLQAMLDKAKSSNLSELTEMCSSIFGQISTSLKVNEIIALASHVAEYNIVSTTGFPYELITMNLSKTGDTIIPADLATNVQKLHEYMFAAEQYEVSDSVKTISESIVDKTGVTTSTETYDLTQFNETVGAQGTEATKKQNKDKNKDKNKDSNKSDEE